MPRLFGSKDKKKRRIRNGLKLLGASTLGATAIGVPTMLGANSKLNSAIKELRNKANAQRDLATSAQKVKKVITNTSNPADIKALDDLSMNALRAASSTDKTAKQFVARKRLISNAGIVVGAGLGTTAGLLYMNRKRNAEKKR